MPQYKAPEVIVATFDERENYVLNREIKATVAMIGNIKDDTFWDNYRPPVFAWRGLSEEENVELNRELVATMRHRIDVAGPEALGAVAAAVIASVVGSVAATIVSKKVDAGVGLPEDFQIDMVEMGGFADLDNE